MVDWAKLLFGFMLVVVGGILLLPATGLVALGAWQVWSYVALAVGAGFYLPALLWRGRGSLSWLSMPGTIFLVNGLALLYSSYAGARAWLYLWTLEPLAVGFGFYTMYLLGRRHGALLLAGKIMTLTGLVLLAAFASLVATEPVARLLGPAILVGLGLGVVLKALLGGRRPRLDRGG
ncbi:MAG: hypothetical protein HY783_11315 [Chloroflexi bacterium]|nr:hypothetical protein [Chloroflexota bacterium]